MSSNKLTVCHCGNTSKVIDLQSKVNKWRRKFQEEVKQSRMRTKVLEQWILSTFGYDIKIDVDTSTSTARIQAAENKEAMRSASSLPNDPQPQGSDSDVKVVMMEVKMESGEVFEQEDVTSVLMEDEHIEIEGHTISMSDPVTHSNSGGESTNVSEQMQVNSQNAEVVYIGDYEDGGHHGNQAQSYFILRSPDNEDIPVQIDYSSLINGDTISGDKVFYRLADASSITASSSSNDEVNAVQLVDSLNMRPVSTKRKSLPSNTVLTSSTSRLKQASTKVVKASSSLPVKKSVTINEDSIKQSTSTMKSRRPASPQTNCKSFEFGLTLREKAEIFVRTKARDVIRKIGTNYVCGVCLDKDSKTFHKYISLDSAMTHTKSHFEAKPYKCAECEELFAVQRELLQHKRESHPQKTKGAVTVNSVKASKTYLPNHKKMIVQLD